MYVVLSVRVDTLVSVVVAKLVVVRVWLTVIVVGLVLTVLKLS